MTLGTRKACRRDKATYPEKLVGGRRYGGGADKKVTFLLSRTHETHTPDPGHDEAEKLEGFPRCGAPAGAQNPEVDGHPPREPKTGKADRQSSP